MSTENTTDTTTTSTATTSAARAAKPDMRWVSVSKDRHMAVSARRHLIPNTRKMPASGVITSACGTTVSGEGIWRANSTKPVCGDCVARASAAGNTFLAP